MTVRLIAAGDLHIGAVSTRLPDAADRDDLSAAAAWLRIVDVAIRHKVDAVLIAGDLIDRQNHYFEAVEALAKGLRKLDQAGIETVAIAGNHDAEVLREVARTQRIQDFTRFRVLGLAGWESASLAAGLRLHAWSFPKSEHAENPFEKFASLGDTEPGAVGLVHGDVDASGGRYAPFPKRSLPPGNAVWIAGHLHRPQFDAGSRLLVPGSPQALAPDERGEHGVWRIDLEGGVMSGEPEFVPISSVRYDQVTVELKETDDRADIRPAIDAALRQNLAVWRQQCPALRTSWACLRFTGTTRWVEDVASIARLDDEPITAQDGDATITVGAALADVNAPIDLHEIARGSDVPAVLARLIVAIDADRLLPEHAALLNKLNEGAARIERQAVFARARAGTAAESTAPGDRDMRTVARAQAERLLARLIAAPGRTT